MIIKQMGKDESFIKYVEDRKGHDLRYSIDCTKLKSLDWKPKKGFEQGLKETIRWYMDNSWWWEKLKS
jgi:dTDP-glucose 4,6-dehydratase